MSTCVAASLPHPHLRFLVPLLFIRLSEIPYTKTPTRGVYVSVSRRLTAVNSHDEIDADEHTVVMAVYSSLLSLPAIYAATRPLLWIAHALWLSCLLVSLFTVMPVAVAFIILYFGCWHLEWPRPKRILLGILSSCLIYGADILIICYGVAIGALYPRFEAGT
jgi:hypothetical protein